MIDMIKKISKKGKPSSDKNVKQWLDKKVKEISGMAEACDKHSLQIASTIVLAYDAALNEVKEKRLIVDDLIDANDKFLKAAEYYEQNCIHH